MVTCGVRRGILAGNSLDAPVSNNMNASPKYVVWDIHPRKLAGDLEEAQCIAHMPVLEAPHIGSDDAGGYGSSRQIMITVCKEHRERCY